jgi:hypothetical protein
MARQASVAIDVEIRSFRLGPNARVPAVEVPGGGGGGGAVAGTVGAAAEGEDGAATRPLKRRRRVGRDRRMPGNVVVSGGNATATGSREDVLRGRHRGACSGRVGHSTSQVTSPAPAVPLGRAAS